MSCGESMPISISPDDIDTGNAEDECDTGDDDEETGAADVGVGSQHELETEDEAEEEPCHPVEEAGVEPAGADINAAAPGGDAIGDQ